MKDGKVSIQVTSWLWNKIQEETTRDAAKREIDAKGYDAIKFDGEYWPVNKYGDVKYILSDKAVKYQESWQARFDKEMMVKREVEKTIQEERRERSNRIRERQKQKEEERRQEYRPLIITDDLFNDTAALLKPPISPRGREKKQVVAEDQLPTIIKKRKFNI